jgi:hypothetical protein
VHLVCNEAEQLARIRARGLVEESAITAGYLAKLNHNLAEVLTSMHTPALSIRSDDINFSTPGPDITSLRARVLSRCADRALPG